MKSILEKMYDQSEKDLLKRLHLRGDKIRYAEHEELPIVYLALDGYHLSPLYLATFSLFNRDLFEESDQILNLTSPYNYKVPYYYRGEIKDGARKLAIYEDKDGNEAYYNVKFLPKELDRIYIKCIDTMGNKPSAVMDKNDIILTVVCPIKYADKK